MGSWKIFTRCYRVGSHLLRLRLFPTAKHSSFPNAPKGNFADPCLIAQALSHPRIRCKLMLISCGYPDISQRIQTYCHHGMVLVSFAPDPPGACRVEFAGGSQWTAGEGAVPSDRSGRFLGLVCCKRGGSSLWIAAVWFISWPPLCWCYTLLYLGVCQFVHQPSAL